MNRRGFLQLMLAAGAAPAIVKASSLMPVRSIVLPTDEEIFRVVAVHNGDTLLTATQITREALRIMHKNMNFVGGVKSAFEHLKPGDLITIRGVR